MKVFESGVDTGGPEEAPAVEGGIDLRPSRTFRSCAWGIEYPCRSRVSRASSAFYNRQRYLAASS